MSKTILFSGRFNPVHLSHIRTIKRLANDYEKVIVCMLDYPNRFEPMEDSYAVMEDCLDGYKGNFEVMINNVNLEHTTQEDMDTLPPFSVVGTGNPNVQANMDMLGIPWVHIERTPGYEGTDIRHWHELCAFVGERKMFRK